MDTAAHNLLVVSDLHLGADLKRGGFGYLRSIVRLDRELSSFLDWYAANREGGLPWRLVINGDMVDFVTMTIVPEAAEQPGFVVTDDDRRFGLATGEEEKIDWLLRRVMDRHRTVFERLAAFVAAGNEVAILRGNHDAEFHWPRVQRTFVDRLAEIGGVAQGEQDAFVQRVSFLPWFYYEPGTIFVEHGHQYDDYSSFEYVLAPVSPEGKRTDVPLSHFAVRYLANVFPNISLDDKDGWTLSDFFRFVWTGQAGKLHALLFGYLGCVAHVIASVGSRKLWSDSRRATHRDVLNKLAERWKLSPERLRRLESLQAAGALRSWSRAIQCYYVDRFAVAGITMASIALVLAADLPFTLLGLSVAAAIAADRVLARTRDSETPPKLRRAALAVAFLLEVPLVVMGHTHRPGEEPLGDGRLYVNTGTWIPAPEAPGFTHLALRRTASGGAQSELRRWTDGGPVRLES